MRITESQLRSIIREELKSSIDRDNKKLIVQSTELEEKGGYDIDRPMIPGGEGSHDSDTDMGRVYEDDDFQKIRLARMKASGMSDDDAERASRSKLRHRGRRPGRG